MSWAATPGSQEEQVGRLILAGLICVFLPQLPLLNYLFYPFVILTTWFHEMGHGVTAMAIGYSFDQLVIFPDGSGLAQSSAEGRPSAIGRALISAGGPLGPVAIGSVLILASSREKYWRPALMTIAVLIGISVLIWVRSLVGVIVLPLVGAGLVWLALRADDGWVRFSVQFLGVLAALSMFRDWDYLFSEGAVIGGVPQLSDTGNIEQALFLPYWVWAIVITGISAVMVGASLKYALNPKRPGSPPRPPKRRDNVIRGDF
ncbi:M50 family metallopeptidase [Qipengyuania sp. JC766]|uniref:M50 family metallopeptidase n=1 Tax=Qipengyuania sp. JC766 TaxID=3232139 RepID=UPI003458CDE9